MRYNSILLDVIDGHVNVLCLNGDMRPEMEIENVKLSDLKVRSDIEWGHNDAYDMVELEDEGQNEFCLCIDNAYVVHIS